MNVFQYPALTDNYNWIISCPETKECAGVDIYDTEPLFNYVEQNNLNLVAILNTHHHQDHVGGNSDVAKKYKNLKFYGSAYDFENKRIACQTSGLSEGQSVNIGNIKLSVIEIPGHTLGHICYFNNEVAFVGDTLFASGCGRLFEGTPRQMYTSFEKLVNNLNPESPVYCGHEYTLANLKFACSLNEHYFREYYQEISQLREKNKMTVPTTMEKELEFNPFLMARNPKLRKELLNMSEDNPVEAFAVLRKKKDNF
jgi:hydroxyacylglutathione hydrolase